MTRFRPTFAILLFGCLALTYPHRAEAQRIEIERPDDSDSAATTSEEASVAGSAADAKEASKEDGENASKQKGKQTGEKTGAPRGIPRFEGVDTRRIRPGDLPPPVSNDIPSVLKKGTSRLPSPPSQSELDETSERVQSRVFEVVALQSPDMPNVSSMVVHRGHAVWVSREEDERPPVLLTTYFWLSDASEIFLVPPDRDISPSERDVPQAERRSLGDITIQPGSEDWLDKHRGALVPTKLYKPDEHRNLVVLVPESTDELDLPMPPLALLDFKKETPARLYGYSPRSGSGLVETQIPARHPDSEALAYYLQTAFGAPFGAPIVDSKGRVLALTAFLHPKNSEITLVVPPSPIEAYLEEVQNIDP